MDNENKCAEKTGCCGSEKTESCENGKKCCGGKLLMGGLAGGIVMFVYYLAAWRFLPWDKAGWAGFIGGGHSADIEYFLLCFVGAALLTKVLKKSGGSCPVFKAMIIGLLVGLFNYLPNMIFFHLPPHDVLVGLVNDFVAFTLAGMTIARCVLKTGGCKMAHCGKEGEKAGGCCDTNKDEGNDKKGCCH